MVAEALPILLEARQISKSFPGVQALQRVDLRLAKGDKSMIPKDGILYVPHKVITKDNVEQFHSELKKLKAAPSN